MTGRSAPRPTLRLLLSALLALGLTARCPTDPVLASEGIATWIGERNHGRRMANGEPYDMHDPTTAASDEFPLGTWLRVTHVASGRRVEVQVRDRGGFSHALDLSHAAFAELAPPSVGRVHVHYEVIAGPGHSPASADPGTPHGEPASSPVALPPSVEPDLGRYVVEEGDTLGSIAHRFGVSVGDLENLNELTDPDLLRPGWVLDVAPPETVEPSIPAVRSSLYATRPPLGGETYVVREGDTLWRIAARYQVDPQELAVANDLGPDAIILVGQELLIATGGWYVVEQGDTLSAIAARHETSVGALLRLNSIDDPDHLTVDQPIRVR